MTPRNDSENISLLPHDLTTEILSWLPVESLLRFKTVCKSWLDTIQQQNFTHLHMRRSSILYPDIMWEVYSVTPDSNGNAESFTYVSSVNGIMLERCRPTDKYRIRNPSTKHILHLPTPKHMEPALMLVIFVVKTKEYKLVSYHWDKTTKRSGFEVLTIGTNSPWRPLGDPTNLQYANHSKTVGCSYINDVLYIPGVYTAGNEGLICLDVVTEKWNEVALPSCLFPDWRNARASNWDGKFSITDVVQEKIRACILEDYKNSKWDYQQIGIPALISEEHPQFREYRILHMVGNKLAFMDKGRNVFTYDTKYGKIRYLLTVPAPGYNNCVGYRRSVLHFRGMQPE